MNDIPCPGLDGANPLHALAAFGLLHLSDRIAPGCALSWQRLAGAWRPVLHLNADPEAHLESVAAWLVALGRTANADPTLAKAVTKTKTARKTLAEDLKKADQAAKAEAKASKLDKVETATLVQERTAAMQTDLRHLDDTLERQQSQLATALGAGIAHLGDIIGTQPEVVRAVASQATQATSALSDAMPRPDDPALVLAHAAALACDGVTEGDKVRPTPFSFGNGASGQCLLKDFRAIAGDLTPDHLRGTLRDGAARWVVGGTSLNWDPVDQRSYALAWDDPATSGKRTDPAANALAYVGLALVPALPVPEGLGAVAWGAYANRSRGWTWPLWTVPLALPVVRGLLAHPDLQTPRPDGRAWSARGVIEIRRCLTINPTGKRLFFAPSCPV
jgi:hypothetical protein